MGLLLGRLSGLRAQWEKEANDVYIPKDLDDCFAELKRILSKEEVEDMKSGPEEDMIDYHHGLGTSLRNTWGLWGGSRLSRWFNEKGIQHPDDMSGIILDSFWRHLNGKPIRLDEQIKHNGKLKSPYCDISDLIISFQNLTAKVSTTSPEMKIAVKSTPTLVFASRWNV